MRSSCSHAPHALQRHRRANATAGRKSANEVFLSGTISVGHHVGACVQCVEPPYPTTTPYSIALMLSPYPPQRLRPACRNCRCRKHQQRELHLPSPGGRCRSQRRYCAGEVGVKHCNGWSFHFACSGFVCGRVHGTDAVTVMLFAGGAGCIVLAERCVLHCTNPLSLPTATFATCLSQLQVQNRHESCTCRKHQQRELHLLSPGGRCRSQRDTVQVR